MSFVQAEVDNWEQYLESVGAGKMTAGMIMKADRVVTISRQLDRQWLIRWVCLGNNELSEKFIITLD